MGAQCGQSALNDDRVLLCFVATGEAKQKWFGVRPQLSNSGQFLAFEKRRSHFFVFDLKTMNRIKEFSFTEPVLAKWFSEDGKRLLVLPGDQTIFLMDIGNQQTE